MECGIVEMQQEIVYRIIGLHRILQEPGGKEHHISGIINDKRLEGCDVLRLQRCDEWFVLWHLCGKFLKNSVR